MWHNIILGIPVSKSYVLSAASATYMYHHDSRESVEPFGGFCVTIHVHIWDKISLDSS